MLNLHYLFTGNDSDSFINRLNPTVKTLETIKKSRADIRAYLKRNLPHMLKNKTNISFPVEPKFFTQGSYRYKTLNEPAHLPPQQSDIDDGCYLPTEDWIDNYNMPKLASQDFYDAVEATLCPLCKNQNWKLDTSKATCVRIVISQDIHVDIPLYAIPEKEFKHLIEARQLIMDSHFADSASVSWEKLPTEHVMLAHRKNGWVKSDPRLVVDWVQEQKELYSDQYTRVVRYLKAFRDFNWISEGPSSLLLMVMASQNFRFCKNRDDLALLHVCAEIPKLLSTEVRNPTDTEEILTERLHDKEQAIQHFKHLNEMLNKAIYRSNASDANKLLRNLFGSRMPLRPDVIKDDGSQLSDFASFSVPVNELIGRTRAG